MSSTIVHTISCSIVALTVAKVNPGETGYVVAALTSASIVDIDHLVYLVKNRKRHLHSGYGGEQHNARSVFHELFGVLLVGCLAGILLCVDQKLSRIVFVAFSLHIVQDWVLGKSTPLAPFDSTMVRFFSLSQRQKIAIDILLLLGSSIVWLIYLTGGL